MLWVGGCARWERSRYLTAADFGTKPVSSIRVILTLSLHVIHVTPRPASRPRACAALQVMEMARAVGLPDIEAACRSAAREKLTGRELVGRLRFCLQYGLQECGGVVQLLQEGQWLRSTYGEVGGQCAVWGWGDGDGCGGREGGRKGECACCNGSCRAAPLYLTVCRRLLPGT